VSQSGLCKASVDRADRHTFLGGKDEKQECNPAESEAGRLGGAGKSDSFCACLHLHVVPSHSLHVHVSDGLPRLVSLRWIPAALLFLSTLHGPVGNSILSL